MAIIDSKPNNPNDAAHKMHNICMKLAHKAVKSNRQDLDDAYQWAQMGVARAYNDWTPDRGCAFSSLAYRYATTYVMDNYKRKAYDYYNNRSFKSAETHLETRTVTDNTEANLEFKQILNKMSTTDQIITLMRHQGYTWSEISEALNKCGNNYTLHQVRTRHLKTMAAVQ